MDNKRYAVIVGINDYSQTELNNLRYCANDAKLIFDSAIELMDFENENIAFFSDDNTNSSITPSYSNILSAIKNMCDKATENDLIMLFFAGHGLSTFEDSYLLTNEYRSNILKDSSMSLKKINDYFSLSKAKFKLRFFDACHSGRLSSRSDITKINFDQGFNVSAEGWATFSACKENQYAYENEGIKHGLFSYFLAKGLIGDAADKAGEITLDGLKIYVLDNIITFTKKMGVEQTPVYCGEQIGNLILAKFDISRNEVAYSEGINNIKELQINDLLPKFENISKDLSFLNDIFIEHTEEELYVAESQEEKINAIHEMMNNISTYLSELMNLNKDIVFNKSLVKIDDIPSNRIIASKISSMNIMSIVELNIKKETRTKYKEEMSTVRTVNNNPFTRFAMNTEETTRQERVKVPYEEEYIAGIEQLEGYQELAITLTLSPSKRTIPVSSMVICCIPVNFGLYLFPYFISTELKTNMKEYWDSTTANLKDIVPIKMHKRSDEEIRNYISSLFSEYISFIKESVSVRLEQIRSYRNVKTQES